MKGAERIAELTLERYRLGELPAAEAARVREAIAADPRLRQRLAALDSSDAAILAARPPAAFAHQVRAAAATGGAVVAAPPPPWSLRLLPAATLAVAFAAASALLVHGPAPDSAAFSGAGDRLKGGAPALMLFRKAEATVERLAPGDVAHERDLVQIAYQSGGRRFGVILSVDGRGVVTRHLPTRGDQAVALQAEGATALETAYRLDDAPRLERFFLVAADAPFAIAPVVEAARSPHFDPLTGDRLPLDQPFAQASFLLRKE